ncbi:unnamed protein product [Aphanomyces euteiches]
MEVRRVDNPQDLFLEDDDFPLDLNAQHIETSSEDGSFVNRRHSSVSTASDITLSNLKSALLDELRERIEEHPLLPLVHQELSVALATCLAQRQRIKAWKDTELDLATKEQERHDEDVKRLILTIKDLQAKIESLQNSASSSHSHESSQVEAIARQLADTANQLISMEAKFIEVSTQRVELERQSKDLQEVNQALSERVAKVKKGDHMAMSERAWIAKQAVWQQENSALKETCKQLELQLSELDQTQNLEHLKQAYRDIIDANTKLQDERKQRALEKARHDQEMENLLRNKLDLTKGIGAKDDEITRLVKELTGIKSRLANAEAQQAAHERMQPALLEEKFQKLQEFDHVSMAYHDAHIALEAQRAANTRLTKDFEQKQTESNKKITSLENDLAFQAQRMEHLSKQLEMSVRRTKEVEEAASTRHSEQAQSNEQLKRVVQDLRLANERLKKENDKAEQEVAKLKSTLLDSSRKIEILEIDLEDRQVSIDRATSLLRQKQDYIEKMDVLLTEERQRHDVQHKDLEHQFKRLQEFDQLSMAYHDNRIAHEKLVIEYNDAKQKWTAAQMALEEQLEATRDRVTTIERELQVAAGDKISLEARLREAQRMCQDLVLKNEQSELEIHAVHMEKDEELDQLRNSYERLSQVHIQLQNELSKTTGEKTALTKKFNEEMNAKMAELHNQIHDKEKRVLHLTKLVDRCETEQLEKEAKTAKHRQDLEAKYRELVETNQELRKLVDNYKKSLSSNDEIVVWVRKEIEEAAKANEILRASLTQVKSESTNLKMEIEKLSDENRSLQHELKAREVSWSSKHKQEIERLHGALHDATITKTKLTNERQEVVKQLRQLLNSTDTTNDDIQALVACLVQAWTTQRSKLKAFEATTNEIDSKVALKVETRGQSDQEIEHLVQQLLFALGHQAAPHYSTRDSLITAIKLAQRKMQPVIVDTPKTEVTVMSKGETSHEHQIAQMNDHLTHMLHQCLALQHRNDQYKIQIKHLKQREKNLEQDLLRHVPSRK